MSKYSLTLCLLLIACCIADAQVVINEAASSNIQTVQDEFSDYPDWIELYNAGTTSQNISGWSLTDNSVWNKWLLPDIDLAAGQRLLVFASGNNLNAFTPQEDPSVNHWETALNDNDDWQYFIGETAPPTNWKTELDNASNWPNGQGGLGYGDNDDLTLVPGGTVSLYYRTIFDVTTAENIVSLLLSMDYDDSFIAYLNGTEIARNGLSGTPDNFSLSEIDHEAAMYNGGDPEQFFYDYTTTQSLIVNGQNILAIEIHNVSDASSDLTGRTWLHTGIGNSLNYFGTNPIWFVDPGVALTENLHTNFKLAYGETLRLYNSDEVLQDEVMMSVQPGHAHARIPDGGSWCYTDQPTPNAENTGTCYSGYSNPPGIFPANGFYAASLSVTMTGASVRYSTNGDQPDLTDNLYGGAISVSSTGVVRARNYQPGKLPSAVVTRTYFINDPSTLPVVSIVAHSGDLFNDGSGGPAVYDNSAGFQQSETTGCTIQYYDADHNFQFESHASLTPVGNFSLDFAQKSLQFQYDEEYGATGDVLYNIFSKDKPGLGPSHGFRVRNTDDDYYDARMRDLVPNRMALSTYSGAAAYKNVVVYINGEFWGHYGAREMLNDYFMRDNYGADPRNVDMVKLAFPSTDYLAEEGTTDTFYAMSDFVINTDMSVQENFDEAEKLIDSKNWVDYFACQIYCNNQDWFPSGYFNNTRLATSIPDSVDWNFLLWDVGYSQGIGGGFYDNLLANTLQYPGNSNLFTDMMNSLLENETFHRYFINRFADLLNWHWTTENVHAIIDECAAEIQPEINRQNNAWGSGDENAWLADVDYLKDFHTVRLPVQRDHIEQYFGLDGQVDITLQVFPAGAGQIKISTIIPDQYPWTGVYFNGNPVEVTAIANPGFTFNNWSANTYITDQNSSSFLTNVASNTTFTANFTGSAISSQIVVTEINYNSDESVDSGDWIELYNSGDVAIDLSDWTFSDQNFYNEWNIPVATIIQPGDYLVLAQYIESFTNQYPNVSNVIGPFEFGLNNNGDSILLKDRFANPVVQFAYDDGGIWPCTPDGHGRTLELSINSANPNVATSWFDGCMGGSPGVAYSACDYDFVVSEINYNSSIIEDAGDWIELHNLNNQPLDISGWAIEEEGGEAFVIQPGTVVASQGYWVFAQNNDLFSLQFPDVSNVSSSFDFGLSGGSDVVRIKNENGILVFSICYKDVLPWPVEADGNGFTLELVAGAENVNLGESWIAGCPEGSPGVAYDPDCNACNVFGCADPLACNFVSAEVCDDGSCTYPGCTDALACNYNASAGCDDNSCLYPGCMDEDACNYDVEALCSDGSCVYPGCTNTVACNYDPLAGCDNSGCVYPGCMDINACNYAPDAGCESGNCQFNTFYEDLDGDNFGSDIIGFYCVLPTENYASISGDCDDANPSVYPGAPGQELGIDNNCNTYIDPAEKLPCLGDLNENGSIGISDLQIFIGNYGCSGTCIADFNEDNAVDVQDLLFFVGVFGSYCP